MNLEEQRIRSLVGLSVDNLESHLKDVLLCFAPFSDVINTDLLPQYVKRLKAQPTLAALPLDDVDAACAEAEARGLISANAEHPAFLRPQPAFGYFLANRLSDPGMAETRTAIETAFVEHMTAYAEGILQAVAGKQPDERKIGLFLAGVEYGNLHRALMLALEQGRSIRTCHGALSAYIDAQQDHRRGLELGETVRAALERAPSTGQSVQYLGERIGVIDDIAKRYLELKRFDEAEQTFQQAAALAGHPQLPATVRAGILQQLGRVAQEQRRFAEAADYYRQSLDIELAYGDRYGAAKTNHQLGVVAAARRQFDEAAGHYRQSLDVMLEDGDRHSAASIYHQLGVVAQTQRRFDEATDYYRQSLDIKLEYGDRHGAATTYHQLGTAAAAQRRFDEAATYYRQSLDIMLEYGDRHSAASTYHQLGMVVEAQHRFDEAADYYRQSLDIELAYGDRHGAASTFHQLGRVAEAQHRFDEAAGYYRQSLDIELEYGDRHGAALTYGQLGNLMRRTDRHGASLDYYLSALPTFLEAGDGGHLAGLVLRNLARLWRARGDDIVITRTAEVTGQTPAEIRTTFEQFAPRRSASATTPSTID